MPLCPVFSNSLCERHSAGPDHPESPARLATVRRRVAEADPLALRDSGPVSLDLVRQIHSAEYLDFVQAVVARGGGILDPDTAVNVHSWQAALIAAGAMVDAVDSALGGRFAFAAVRPPGHHALESASMGFCLLGNIVIGARHARGLGIERILIVDWDVHHGNGTQALVERDPAIHFVSMHQWPHWPYTGSAEERGVGNVFNVPMAAGLARTEYLEALWAAVGRATRDFAPELILISAGCDSLAGDPLGDFTLEPSDYAAWVERLRTAFPKVPIAAVMEGGYVPSRLADGVIAIAEALA